jgi:hypothetical protein
VATFTDPAGSEPVGDYSAAINWGDNSNTDQTGAIVSNGNGQFTVRGSHKYTEDGGYKVTVTLQHDRLSTVQAGSSTATVADAPLAPQGETISGLAVGVPFSGEVAAFSDADPNAVLGDFTARITWGDGHTAAGTITRNGSSFRVAGSNTYTQLGAYTVSVQITDNEGNSAASAAQTVTATSTAKVVELLTTKGTTITPTEGVPFSGVVATFTDSNTNATTSFFTAAITWGDGNTSKGTVTGGTGNFSVSAANSYVEEGNNIITVQITDNLGNSTTTTPVTASAASTANVGDATPVITSLSGTASLIPGQPDTFTAGFSDTRQPGHAHGDLQLGRRQPDFFGSHHTGNRLRHGDRQPRLCRDRYVHGCADARRLGRHDGAGQNFFRDGHPLDLLAQPDGRERSQRVGQRQHQGARRHRCRFQRLAGAYSQRQCQHQCCANQRGRRCFGIRQRDAHAGADQDFDCRA